MKKVSLKLTGGIFNNRMIVSYSEHTRPTSQMVRQAVFNMLHNVGGVVLDLFAGSGAYGFEALSRGASFAHLNDVNKDAIRSIKENIKALNVDDQTKLTKMDYKDALTYYTDKEITFDYVFLDPPYDMKDEAIYEIMNTLKKQKTPITIIIERNSKDRPLDVKDYECIKDRKYGLKHIYIYKKQ